MANIQKEGGLQQSPSEAAGLESIDPKISSPSDEMTLQSWSPPMLGGDTSVNDNSIKIGSISNRSTNPTTVKKSTPELAPIEEVKGHKISCLQQDILNLQKDKSGGGLEKKYLSHPIIQEKDETLGVAVRQCSSKEESHMVISIGGSSNTTSEKTVDMMSLSVPVKPELKSTTSVGGIMGDDLAVSAAATCKGSDTVQHTTSTPDCDNEGKTEPATDSTESQEGESTVGPNVIAEQKPQQLSIDNKTEDLSELIPISQLISQKKLKGKMTGGGGTPKPKVGPGELWVKDDLVLSVSLINKLLELMSAQMTSAIETLRDKWCGCGTALKSRHPQYAPAIDWESVSNKINDKAWTPKLCQAIWKYVAYADLTVADLLANPSLTMKQLELEEDSDQDDFFVDSLKLNRKDVSNNKRKRLWGRGIINWPFYETKDKGSVISLTQGPKKPKSRRRAAMSVHTAPCINLCPPVAYGPQTSCKLQPATTTTENANLLINVAKLPLPTPVPVLDIGMLGKSVQAPPAVIVKKKEESNEGKCFITTHNDIR